MVLARPKWAHGPGPWAHNIGARGFLCDISQPRRMMDGGLASFQNSSAGGGGGGVHLMDMWGAPPPTPPESRLLPQPPKPTRCRSYLIYGT